MDHSIVVLGSLNVDQNKNARDASIIFVGTVPYVAWTEGEGVQERVFVRHLASDPQTGTWTLDSPKEGFAVDKNRGASTVSLSQAGADKVAIVFRQGDTAKEASQVAGATIQIK